MFSNARNLWRALKGELPPDENRALGETIDGLMDDLARLRQELSAERERADEHQRERTRLLRERDAAEAGRSALARFREATK